MALSKRTREILAEALTDTKLAKEVADKIDANVACILSKDAKRNIQIAMAGHEDKDFVAKIQAGGAGDLKSATKKVVNIMIPDQKAYEEIVAAIKA